MRPASRVVFILAWFLLTRAIALGATHAGARFMTAEKIAEWSWRLRMPGAPPGELAAPTVRWDAHFYVSIARDGYPHWTGGRINYTVAFFPLYPLAIRSLAGLAGDDFSAALLISNLATLFAAFAMYLYGARLGGPDAGLRGCLLLLASPGAHFLAYPYPEGLFVLFLASALYWVASDRPLAAAVPGALASATRSAGIVVAFALLLSAWQHRRSPRRILVRVAAAAISLAGIAAFAAFCYRDYGDALAFFHVQKDFHRHLTLWGPLVAFFRFEVDPDYYLVTLAAAAAAVIALRRRVDETSASGAFLVWLPLASGTMKSMIRYLAADVPLVASVAGWLEGKRFALVLGTCLALMTLEAFLFGKGIGHS